MHRAFPKTLSRAILPLLLVALAGCDAMVRSATRNPMPLSHFREVRFGEPTTEDGHVVVPVDCPTRIVHSGNVTHAIDAAVDGGTIVVTVWTCLVTDGRPEDSERLVLPPDTRGTFAVVYRDPDGTGHPIGTLAIE